MRDQRRPGRQVGASCAAARDLRQRHRQRQAVLLNVRLNATLVHSSAGIQTERESSREQKIHILQSRTRPRDQDAGYEHICRTQASKCRQLMDSDGSVRGIVKGKGKVKAGGMPCPSADSSSGCSGSSRIPSPDPDHHQRRRRRRRRSRLSRPTSLSASNA